jgi:hypothetical protein
MKARKTVKAPKKVKTPKGAKPRKGAKTRKRAPAKTTMKGVGKPLALDLPTPRAGV